MNIEQELLAFKKALVIRGMSDKTINIYSSALKSYLATVDKPLEAIQPSDIQAW